MRLARALVALLCLVAVLVGTAGGPSVAHLDLGLPVLVFCFLVVLQPLRWRASDADPAAQPVALLAVHISRAPPLA